ncbi:TonB-dependent receptor [candidate division KSB1 bacterium]|nr:TonB-dependent receptor [candidate division KSB1 bacterium]NIR73120.1 TonB-dependent receptor [candidate division KSB1 bacterium]NIS27855.1 TonB-dependent receptor [candidate division KSB1 bacterium]NIT74738.1 TonB-dependent receptor [candidate division KSB1 bacterium]NIU28520.1 TonB-dependent receptor [candidate division KSB1 bacterium]
MADCRVKLGVSLLCCCLLFCLSSLGFAQKATLGGTVTDEESGETLPGANVAVTAPGIQTGAATDTEGYFEVRNLPPGMYTVTISYIGYEEKVLTDVEVTAGETKSLDVTLLATGIEINPISVTASRRPEKTLEAPASISVLEARELNNDVSPSTSTALRNVTGLDMAQTGVDRTEVVLRGFNNAFSGEAYVLTDNRQAAVASLGVNVHSIMPNQTTDLERVEIVRGPGAALYGAGVDEGVIHYITKDPFNYPGTTFSFSGGQRTSVAAQFRHAGVINNQFGYKITAQFAQADDWELNPNNRLDSLQLAQDREGVERDYDYQKINVNGMAQYRFSDDVVLTLNGGFSSLDAVILTGVGTAQAKDFGYSYGQLRLQAGNFFAQTYLNVNNLGDSFVYSRETGIDALVDNSTLWNIQAQYNLETWGGRQQFIIGFDYDRTTPDTDGTIFGRFEDQDLISEPGGYIQSQTAISPKLDLTVALRGDYNNVTEDFILSPRVAGVFKPTAEHSFRVSYNRAFTSPGNTENFLDLGPLNIPGAPFSGRGLGSAFGHTFERDPAFGAIPNSNTDLVAYSINPATPGARQPVGLPLAPVYDLVYQQLSSLPISVIRSMLPPPLNDPNVVPDQQLQGLIGLLDPMFTNVAGLSPGGLGIANLSTGQVQPIQDVTDIKPLDLTITQTLEAGYKGLLENRVLFAVDVYYTRKEDFVGPLLVESPLVFIDRNRVPDDLADALAAGIDNNTVLAGLLQQFNLTPEQVAALIVGLAQEDLVAQLPNQQTPIAIVTFEDNTPQSGQLPELVLSYRNFGEVDFWGVDAAIQVIASDRLSFFGNVSIVSDDFFDNEELDETNTALSVALNAPSFKTKFGFNYRVPFGVSVNASARYIEGFPVESGPYVGDIDDYFLLDLGFGYDLGRFAPGARFDFLVQNALDNDHREFIGAPEIGRFAMARITYSIR